ncbi:MAG TPA: aldolase/citrate lyase family protein [Vicinamibacteria bacterium]|nr:aldolase/citrate lyase family protein [Vicinamibacteria bacterium]
MMHLVLVAVVSTPVVSTEGPKRVNKLVELLASGKPVFGIFSGEKTPAVAAQVAANEQADFVFYDLERGPFDVLGMQIFMQFMIDRASVARSGTVFNERPLVARLPPIRDGRIEAQDRVKRLLDAGVYGIVFPHVESREDAELAVSSMRYRPAGKRPLETGDAPRYWGLGEEDYRRRSDLWPVNPEGELVNMLLIEDQVGVRNAREIVSTEGVSIVFPGPGDLRRAYENDSEAVESAIQTVLAACKEFDVVCGITAGPGDIEKRLAEGFRVVIVTAPEALEVGRRASGR